MNENFFQSIFDKLQDILPMYWDKLVFYAGYTTGSYSMKYYIGDGNGQYIDCFSQSNINKSQLIKLFMEIDKIISHERNKFDDEKKWNVLTMVIDVQGNMKTEFDYVDISENSIEYEQEWKKKFL